jgi:membrane-associated phospholipid phosphatase
MNISSVVARNKWFFLFYTLFLIAGGYYFFHYSKAEGFLLINQWHSNFADVFFKYYTNAGDGLVYVALILIFLFINRWSALIGLWGFASSSLTVQLVKQVIIRDTPRPKTFFENPGVLHFVDGVTVHGFGSFPSGHTATAFSIALWLAYLTPNKFIGALYLIPAILVGYSRIYLAQHFPEDVMIGSLIGIVTTILVIAIMEGRKNKKGKAS